MSRSNTHSTDSSLRITVANTVSSKIQEASSPLTWNQPKKIKDILTVNDIQSIINSEVPENFRNQNYDVSLNAVAKIPVSLKEQCIRYDLSNFEGVTRWGHSTGIFVRVFDWLIIIFATITLVLALVFVGSLLFASLAQKEETKLTIARIYVIASFALVFIALIGSIIYFFVFRHYLGSYSE